ncbi:MAG: FAD-dependent oxidoreductase, partial [Actinomycetes bacterium]
MERIVIAGGGLAGARTAQALREHGYAGDVTLVGAEPHPPYDRPPLSKALLQGETDDTTLDLDWGSLEVELLLGRTASAVRDGPEVEVDGVGPRRADAVVLATGSVPITLPGTQQVRGVHVLRTVEHARALRAELRPGARVAVVGAGWIGAEVAT